MASTNKNTLPCGVVRDLLPLYIEGLANEETKAMVEAHLAACADCRATCEAMREGAPPEEALARLNEERQRNLEEAQYLRRIKRKHRRAVWLSMAAVALVVFLGFYIFTGHTYPINTSHLEVSEIYMLEGNTLYVKLYASGGDLPIGAISSGSAYLDENGNQAKRLEDAVGFEFYFGSKLTTRLKNKNSEGHITLLFNLDEGYEAVYISGWQGKNRLLLWQLGDEVPAAPEELQQNMQTSGGGGFLITGS